jgi:sucrose phosphorylase
MKYYRSQCMDRLRQRFLRLYGEAKAESCLERLAMLIGRYGVGLRPDEPGPRWSQQDVFLITYGDMVREKKEAPLATLLSFLKDNLPSNVLNTVHILPFFPYSSDDGFSIIDYRAVNPELGSWHEIEALSLDYKLMVDLVLNHVSRKSSWFRDYVSGISPGCGYFIEADPQEDLSEVVRPRNLPLLTPTHTRYGLRHLWTTFSEDQIDLNFANPDVLFEFLDLLLLYISHGATVVRLDAIAYLWKTVGTSCIHLPETHQVVKLMRDLLDLVAPHVLLMTETNVPHRENVSYFGDGDEAHIVYQFSLPPLLLYTLQSGNAAYLNAWAGALAPPPSGCTFLNFTASHDGVGVRPLEGLLPKEEVQRVLDGVVQRGGHVSTKANPDGTQSPYELNITYFDALSDPDSDDSAAHVARFLCSQSIAMELQGIPALYFHSLVATGNDQRGVQEQGHFRAINRRKWELEDLQSCLGEPDSVHANVFTEYRRLLQVRTQQPAFHPDASQRVLDLGDSFFALVRTAADSSQVIVAITNVTGENVELTRLQEIPELGQVGPWRDLIAGGTCDIASSITLNPYQTLWLTA